MRSDVPDTLPEASLAARLAEAARVRLRAGAASPGRRQWAIAAALAALIAAGPLLTTTRAWMLAAGARAEAARLGAATAPRVAAETALARTRAELAALVRRPTIGATLDALARALPPEASLIRAGRDAQGLLTVEVAAPDPDQLRAAIRRDPLLAALRDTGQRQQEATMIVTMRERAQ